MIRNKDFTAPNQRLVPRGKSMINLEFPKVLSTDPQKNNYISTLTRPLPRNAHPAPRHVPGAAPARPPRRAADPDLRDAALATRPLRNLPHKPAPKLARRPRAAQIHPLRRAQTPLDVLGIATHASETRESDSARED